MARLTRRQLAEAAEAAHTAQLATAALDAWGLHLGDRVRFQRADGGRWQELTITGIGSDGSITLRDSKGAARSIAPDRLEVRTSGTRRSSVWRPVADHARTAQQRSLF
jgi:biotin-(acetyl-CoA carboxylase) ligase